MPCDNEDFPHIVTIRPRASTNRYGEGVSGHARRVSAYVDPAVSMSRMPSQEDETRGTTVVVDDIEVEVDDRIVMPDGVERIIQSVNRFDFEPGMYHSIVTVA